MLAGRADWRQEEEEVSCGEEEGGRTWGGEVNNREIVLAMAAPNPSVRSTRARRSFFTVGFYSFCYLPALGFAVLPEKWPGNIKALLFQVKPGVPFAPVDTV